MHMPTTITYHSACATYNQRYINVTATVSVTEAIRSYTPISRAPLIYGIPFTHADILSFSCEWEYKSHYSDKWTKVEVPPYTCLLYADIPRKYRCIVNEEFITFDIRGRHWLECIRS